MQNYLILIDGPKGAGKSTLSELLRKKLTSTVFFNIDEERRLIEKSGDRDTDNKSAFMSIIEKSIKVFEQKKNVVLDSAVFGDRLDIIENITKRYKVKLNKFSLTALPETLRARVKEREELKGKKFDSNRFDYLLKVLQNRSLEGFYILDSDKLSPQQIFDIVFSKVI
ncbi:MAG: AAA family ATPase [Candidatus Nomurabacteria bacterium]